MVSIQAPSAANFDAALGEIIFKATAFKNPDVQIRRRCGQRRLPNKRGEKYTEVRLNQFEAYRLASGQNPMEVNRPEVTPTSAKPTMIYTAFAFEWDAQMRPQVDITGKFPMQARQAMDKLIDEDGLVMGNVFPKTFGSAGGTLTFSTINAAKTYIKNARDKLGGEDSLTLVITPNQHYALMNHLTNTGNLAAADYGPMRPGMTQDYIRNGTNATPVAGVPVIAAENLYADANDDAAGFMFQREALWYVGGRPMWGGREETQRGGGTEIVYMYDEYVFHGPYPDKGWAVRILADSTSPTG